MSQTQGAYQRAAAGGQGITGISEDTQGPGNIGVLTQRKRDFLVNTLDFPLRLENVTEPKDGSNYRYLCTEEKFFLKNPKSTSEIYGTIVDDLIYV